VASRDGRGHALVAGDHGESPVQVLSFLSFFSTDGGLLRLVRSSAIYGA